MKNPKVIIVMGSQSDWPTLTETAKILKDFKVSFEVRVLSAHRTPEETAFYSVGLERRGVQVAIAAAGGAAALAGVVAAHTSIPVIGIPIEASSLNGMDSLLSTVQMPPGVPVATVAIGKMGAKNAAYLAIRILALNDQLLNAKLKKFKKEQADKIKKIKIVS
ncbi:MAG: 5-(carboxyamino)imidazole ribonucleotide mutase [Candidatus Omnitrophica bacterium]|nr:5-(carboxyamino)imidazole ribonucleotide mutase [Candidatus Omnitrophota bacterium]